MKYKFCLIHLKIKLLEINLKQKYFSKVFMSKKILCYTFILKRGIEKCEMQ